MDSLQQLKKGTAETLVLGVLSSGPRHGYAIARELESRSEDVLSLGEGTLYPILRALEGKGFVQCRWEEQESGPKRRVYTLTEEGSKALAIQRNTWHSFAGAVNAVLGGGKA